MTRRPIAEGRPRIQPAPLTLVEAVTHAFAEGGPVERVMGQHRVLQEQSAIGLANYVQNNTRMTELTIWIQQQRAGIGKTLAVLIVLSLDKLLNDRSSMIATFTRAMRLSYLKELDHVDAILQQTLDELNNGHLYRPMLIGEHQSVTPYLSPSKIEAAKARKERGRSEDELIAYYDTAFEHGDVPSFDGFYEQGGVLPRYTDPLHWGMCSSDRNHRLWQRVIEGNEEARDADIMLVTHAMLIRSNIARGQVLHTNQDVEDEPRTGIVVCDEADKLPQVAFDALTMGISHNDTRDLLQEFGEVYKSAANMQGRQAVETARFHMEQGLAFFSEWLSQNPPPRLLIINREDSDGPDNPLSKLNDAIDRLDVGMIMMRGIAIGQHHHNDRDILIADRIRMVHDSLRVIGNMGSYTFPKIGIETFIDHYGHADVRVFINFAAGRHLINQLWRTRQSGVPLHGFSGAAFISATLTDLPPNIKSYRWFKRAIGFGENDQAMDMEPIPQNIRRHPYGRIQEVAVVSRDWPHPTDEYNPPTMINQHFVTQSSIALASLAERHAIMAEHSRMLVLFPSFDLVDAFYDALPTLHDRIVKRDKNANLFTDIARFAKQPHGIWFGVEWEGVNFVDPEPPAGQHPRTLADILVLTRIPQPPTNQVRRARIADGLATTDMGAASAERRAEAISLYEGIGLAYRKMTQGVGRAIRNPDDVIQLLAILDLRFPVPLHVSDTRKIARSGGDPTKMFYHFDAILEPYSVRRWSQIDKEGNITPIVT